MLVTRDVPEQTIYSENLNQHGDSHASRTIAKEGAYSGEYRGVNEATNYTDEIDEDVEPGDM